MVYLGVPVIASLKVSSHSRGTIEGTSNYAFPASPFRTAPHFSCWSPMLPGGLRHFEDWWNAFPAMAVSALLLLVLSR
jgi:hypothetical protein